MNRIVKRVLFYGVLASGAFLTFRLLDLLMTWGIYSWFFGNIQNTAGLPDTLNGAVSIWLTVTTMLLIPTFLSALFFRRTAKKVLIIASAVSGWLVISYFLAQPGQGQYFNKVTGQTMYRYYKGQDNRIELLPLGYKFHPRYGTLLLPLTPEIVREMDQQQAKDNEQQRIREQEEQKAREREQEQQRQKVELEHRTKELERQKAELKQKDREIADQRAQEQASVSKPPQIDVNLDQVRKIAKEAAERTLKELSGSRKPEEVNLPPNLPTPTALPQTIPLAYFGSWRNSDPNTRNITKLWIRENLSRPIVNAWGSCHPQDCDWGLAGVTFKNGQLFAVWDHGFAVHRLELSLDNNGQLKVTTQCHFTDTSGRADYEITDFMIRYSETQTAAKVLATPTQLSPPNGSIFDFYPRTTVVKWNTVLDATYYVVEEDCYHCCVSGSWCTDLGRTFRLHEGIRGTELSFDFVGAQPGRWRVWAVDKNGRQGPKSPWWEFKYLQ
jgi:hypothetical protein